METVRGYAAHERGTLDAVVTARGGAIAAAQSPAGVGGFRGRDYFEAAGGERGPVQVRF